MRRYLNSYRLGISERRGAVSSEAPRSHRLPETWRLPSLKWLMVSPQWLAQSLQVRRSLVSVNAANSSSPMRLEVWPGSQARCAVSAAP